MIHYLEEPQIIFGNNQTANDPRDGLILFGPNEALSPYSVKAGVIGTIEGLEAYKSFVNTVNKPIYSNKTIYGVVKSDEIARPSYPGFESIFNIKWQQTPETFIEINKKEIDRIASEKNKKKRTSNFVDLYLEKIIKTQNNDETSLNIWFVIVPRIIFQKCKPQSKGRDLSKGTIDFFEKQKLGQFDFQFGGDEFYSESTSKFVDTSVDFHDLLKARLIQEKVQTPIQIMIESTLLFRDKYKNKPFDDNMMAHLAWTQSTTLYYKLGKLPWRLGDVRPGVCYLGLVFKKLNKLYNKKSVCSAAQMFLSDGDGSVFRGNVGPWESENEREYHLDFDSANLLMSMALDDYSSKWGKYPNELFIHGRAKFADKEWDGFKKAINDRKAQTNLVGIVIRDDAPFKLFRDVEDQKSNYGVLRGIAVKINEKEGYLFTRGYIPRLNTSSSLEVPNPLNIKITHGNSDFINVAKDILALTKLNYNACVYGDGFPVTLRFSDNIGKILTATENWKVNVKQFKYYI